MSVSPAIADLCGPVSPAAAPDAAESATYAAVGDDEHARDARVAATAYRKAIALDASNAHARDALAALCGGSREDHALLAGIARFTLGDLDAAEALFASLVAGPDAPAAHFYLGLIGLARHDGAASDELAIAARDPAYAPLTASLQRIARRQGMFELLLLAAPEVDTNPQLLPDTPPTGATTGPAQADADLLVGGTATAHPTRWLVVRDAVTFRRQATLTSLDYLGEEAQAEATAALGGDRVAVRYDLDYDRIGGASYLFANRGTVAYRHQLDGVALIAEYALRYRDYREPTESAFTGWVQTGAAGAILRVAPTIDLDVRATLAYEHTADPTFADLAAGAIAAIHMRPADRFRLTGALTAWYAHYDAAEPDGTIRADLHGALSADLEIDVADRVIALAGIGLEGNESTVDDFRYWRLAARVGVAFAVGGP